MRKLLLLLALAVVLVATAAVAGITIDPASSKRFEFVNCNADGTTTASQTVTEGTYLFRVTDEKTWVCWAATCATLGEQFQAGFAMMVTIGRGGQAFSCRSTSSTGDVIFTRATQ